MMDPGLLQRLREESGLRLDKEGRFWHRGGLVEHGKTIGHERDIRCWSGVPNSPSEKIDDHHHARPP